MGNRYKNFDSVLDEQDYMEFQLPEDADFEDEDYEDDGQPSWEKEWEDFGEVYSDERDDFDYGSDY